MPADARKKVLVALSGGVDSSVCVHLLKEQGYDVTAVVLRMSPAHDDTVSAAREAAAELNIPLVEVDAAASFEKEVISYFVNEYLHGRTPNPCIVCNPKVKFKTLLDTADELGIETIATGHYARLLNKDGKTLLMRGESMERDQSYMLYRLTQRELSRLIFPLGMLQKPYVRELAQSNAISASKRPDSQENCFIPDNDYASYIISRGYTPAQGDFIAPDGSVCGQHKGIIHYTVGQRRGLGIALGRPVFVREIDFDSNRIYLADFGEDLSQSAVISQINTISGEAFPQSFQAQAKIRSVAKPVEVTVTMLSPDHAKVDFALPQRAVAKGQSLVLYDDNIVLGGGFIE